jgi:16S rRNA (cytosine1402-N4)-methyltransferase
MNGHVPVMLDAAMRSLAPEGRGGVFVDATVGGGGQTEEILKRASPQARVIGFDLDATALERVRQRLAEDIESGRLVLVHGDFKSMVETLDGMGIEKLSGVTADLGVSSFQLDEAERGFSFRLDGPLDMRMDASNAGPDAAELLNSLPERELEKIFREFGEERYARAIARRIVAERARRPFETTRQLAEMLASMTPVHKRQSGLHPATRTFQALRIAVNRELEGLAEWIDEAVRCLEPGARIVVIAFHSLEDRIVKHTLRRLENPCICPPRLPVCQCGRKPMLRFLHRKAVTSSSAETAANPRSRSAHLRAAERLPEGRMAA